MNNKKAYTYEMNLLPANLLCLFIFAVMVVVSVVLKAEIYPTGTNTVVFFTLLIGYLCLHELLHGIGFIIGGAKRKNIKYGICIEKGIFYCLAYQELTKKNILISLLMPFIVIGIITYIIGIIFSISLLTFLSIVNISGASMDLIMFFYVLCLPKNTTYSESGRPDQFVLISDVDLKKRKNIFLKIIEEKDYKVEDYIFTDVKKIDITKKSIVIIALFLLLGVLISIT